MGSPLCLSVTGTLVISNYTTSTGHFGRDAKNTWSYALLRLAVVVQQSEKYRL